MAYSCASELGKKQLVLWIWRSVGLLIYLFFEIIKKFDSKFCDNNKIQASMHYINISKSQKRVDGRSLRTAETLQN